MAIFSTIRNLQKKQGLTKSMLGQNPVFTGQNQVAPPQTPQFSLPENYGFNDLAGYEEARRNAQGQNFQNQIGQLRTGIQGQYDTALKGFQDTAAQRRSALSSSLAENARKNFQLQNPAILEDLNSRGLFSSPSTVANAQAQAMKELELANADKLTSFDTSSQGLQDQLQQQRLQALTGLDTSGTSANLQAQQDALDSSLDLRRGQLESKMQESQAGREEALARDLAREQRKAGITNSLIGAGGGILGGLLQGGGGGGMGGGGGGGGGLFSGLFGGGGGGSLSGAATGQTVPGVGAVGTGVPPAGGGIGLGGGLGLAGLGIAGYSMLPENGLFSKSTIAPLANPLATARKGTQALKKGANILSSGASNVGKSIGGAGRSIAGAFCFDPSTPIIMEDGSEKEIQTVMLGDKTKGGEVKSIRISITDNGSLFERNGIVVTGSHAVKEQGTWIRVKDSIYAQPLAGDGTVFSLVTTDHRIYIKDAIYADEHETDTYEYLTLDQSLNQLNYEEQRLLSEVN